MHIKNSLYKNIVSTQNIFLIIFLLFFGNLQSDCAMTFDPGNDRFGDQLMNYIRAKYLSTRDNIKLLIPNFMYSDQLFLSCYETLLTSRAEEGYKRLTLKNAPKKIRAQDNVLFVIPFDIKITEWPSFDAMYLACKNDMQFSQELKKLITPIKEIIPLQVPTHVVATVAVHVRKGGGFDAPLLSGAPTNEKKSTQIFADKIWPTKFPPDEFYIEQINYLSNMLNNPPLYIHIFTDDKDPQEIAEKYEKVLGKSNLIFGYRTAGNHHNAHVLEDLINMAKCDYLIRPQSSYSRVAQIIGDHQLIISPITAHWRHKKLVVDKISRVRPPCRENYAA